MKLVAARRGSFRDQRSSQLKANFSSWAASTDNDNFLSPVNNISELVNQNGQQQQQSGVIGTGGANKLVSLFPFSAFSLSFSHLTDVGEMKTRSVSIPLSGSRVQVDKLRESISLH